MKKLILILFTIIGLNSYSQDVYPKLQENPITKKAEIVFTIEQGNKVNNSLDVLNQLNVLIKKYEIQDSIEVKFIDGKNNVISKLEISIDNLKLQVSDRNNTIKQLNDIIASLNESLSNCETKDKQDVKEIKKQKFIKTVSLVANVILISVLAGFYLTR